LLHLPFEIIERTLALCIIARLLLYRRRPFKDPWRFVRSQTIQLLTQLFIDGDHYEHLLFTLASVADAGDGLPVLLRLLCVHRSATSGVKSSGAVIAVEVHLALVRLQHLLVVEVALAVVAPWSVDDLLQGLSCASSFLPSDLKCSIELLRAHLLL
jgi:hypothetical protein